MAKRNVIAEEESKKTNQGGIGFYLVGSSVKIELDTCTEPGDDPPILIREKITITTFREALKRVLTEKRFKINGLLFYLSPSGKLAVGFEHVSKETPWDSKQLFVRLGLASSRQSEAKWRKSQI